MKRDRMAMAMASSGSVTAYLTPAGRLTCSALQARLEKLTVRRTAGPE
jgi:hypothetical protein